MTLEERFKSIIADKVSNELKRININEVIEDRIERSQIYIGDYVVDGLEKVIDEMISDTDIQDIVDEELEDIDIDVEDEIISIVDEYIADNIDEEVKNVLLCKIDE